MNAQGPRLSLTIAKKENKTKQSGKGGAQEAVVGLIAGIDQYL